MKTLFKQLIVPAILSFSLLACDNNTKTDGEQMEGAQNSTTGTYPANDNAAKDDVQARRTETTSGWNSRMDEIDRELQELDKKIENEKGSSKQAWQQRRAQLKEEREALKGKLDRAGKTTDAEWDSFKKEVDDDFDRLGNSVKDIFRDDDKK